MSNFIKWILFGSLIFASSLASIAQVSNYYDKYYRRDSGNPTDSLRSHNFERLVYDSANNHLYAIMQTWTPINDSTQYAFPIMMRIAPEDGTVLLEKKDSMNGLNIGYSALLQSGDNLYWAGWQQQRDLLEAENGLPLIVKTDKNFNVIWRKTLPNTLKISRATQIKEYGDTLFVSTFHWSPALAVPMLSSRYELSFLSWIRVVMCYLAPW